MGFLSHMDHGQHTATRGIRNHERAHLAMAGPKTAILHSVGESAAEELATTIRERLPDLDLAVARTPPESEDAIADAEVAITLWLPEELLDSATNLRWVQAISAGVDHHELDRLQEDGVALTNASGVHAQPIAEQVLGYMLAFERGIAQGIRQQERGVWERYSGGELLGKTLGVVGLGAIGTRVAQVGAALGMETIGTKRDPSSAPDVVDEAFGPDGLWEVLTRSDYLVLACPLTDETEGLIGSDKLAAMGSEAVLVNIARGGVVDQDALTRTLQQHHIGGAALDVFETEPLPQDSVLWNLSNVIVTPHMAGSTPKYWERCGELFVENYERYVERGPEALENRVL